ncbi:MAG: Fur family transcriptional regulator [Actinomycetaceae bacterium]|nr:Fur family transcriptional regulator [Actinomycetaceae bacterium]
MSSDYASILRGAGLRVTAARMSVLEVIDERDHPDADAIRVEVGARLGSISGQAVYDALNILTAKGILRRVEPAGRRARYELDCGDNHHHVVCRRCGRVADVTCAVGEAPCLEPRALEEGWNVASAEVFYWGLCPDCPESV